MCNTSDILFIAHGDRQQTEGNGAAVHDRMAIERFVNNDEKEYSTSTYFGRICLIGTL
jgi:hypothetical protein